MILAGTGHRPRRLGLTYSLTHHNRLTSFVKAELKKLTDVKKVITGGAAGFDQALYAAAYELGIPYIVAVPFVGQDEKWSKEGKLFYSTMLEDAESVVVVCEGDYANWKYVERDKWMVDHCDALLSLLDNKPIPSGTRTTTEYAQSKNVPVISIYQAFRREFRG